MVEEEKIMDNMTIEMFTCECELGDDTIIILINRAYVVIGRTHRGWNPSRTRIGDVMSERKMPQVLDKSKNKSCEMFIHYDSLFLNFINPYFRMNCLK